MSFILYLVILNLKYMRKKDKAQYIDLSDHELAMIYQQEHDNLALELLFERYNNYIYKIASSYYWRTNLENEDILAEAKLGFMKGVEKYDTEGYFMYFTGMWVKVNILVAIDNDSRLIRIPVNRLKDMRKINMYIENIYNDPVSAYEIAEYTGIDIDKVKTYLSIDNSIANLKTVENTDSTESIYTQFNAVDLRHDLKEVLKSLSDIEYYIIVHTYGLFDNPKIDKLVIAENLGLSGERVRQIKNKVIRKLRHSNFSSILQQYLD